MDESQWLLPLDEWSSSPLDELRIDIVAAVAGRSAAMIIAPISIESEVEAALNIFVVAVLEFAIGASIFGSVEYGIWR